MLTLDDYERLDDIPKPGTKRDRYRHLRSTVPEGTSGNWSVAKFEIERGIGLLRMMRDGRGSPPGQYTQLLRGGSVIMSDTDAELGDLRRFFNAASRYPGRVLIHGLGLGVALSGVLAIEATTHVDVVELSEDVLKLVAPHFPDPRVEFHHADCFTKKWQPGTRWNTVWHDIWDNICRDNLDGTKELTRKFARRCQWQHCWAREWIPV